MMNSEELRVCETDVVYDSERPIHLAYDETGDILEVVFDGVEATTAVELTDNILLRFNHERGLAAGLTILDFSLLARPTEMGPQSFAITGLDNLPAELRQTVVKIITTPPVNRFLKVSLLYTPPAQHIPITTVERLPALASAISS
jgi:hypothetical protein